jgi:phosphoribosyl 1,2-cyclic phosphate phosphodiesterase
MRITFLGTGAANAFPEAFCRCGNCEKARALGGPSLRKRASALVNDDLLIDLGPDIKTAAAMHNRPLTGVRYCLQTHPHADHMDVSHLLTRSPGFGVVGAPRLHFYASPATLQRAVQTFERDLADYSLLDPDAEERLNLQAHPIEPLRPFAAGPYRVIAFPANHTPRGGALLYSIESGGRSLFYGTDTAALPEETWRGFHQHQLKFNVVILDHTYGPDEPGSDHLSARDVIQHAARMREEGLLADSARVYATHIAHEGNPPHPELTEFAAQHGYGIAYDGLAVEV